ncbi:MAG: kinase/pyrophosphorylase [Phreatobacter sp.]|nr:kinase/pyrophosphorylase [Phreatobacter sp.]
MALSELVHSPYPHCERAKPVTHRHESYFHLHLVSDATGETLMTVGRAAAVQYATVSAIEHIYPLVRSQKQLDRVLTEIEANPGIVLYTLVDHELSDRLTTKCREFGCPCLSVLEPVLAMFQNYLGAASTPRVGAQHMLNAEYFQRIDALNYTMMHDDGQLPENWEEADVLLMGVSRTSKTPTSIYLANRGVKTANMPLVPGIALPPQLDLLQKPLIVGLFASPERIVQIRENRILSLNATQDKSSYVDRTAVAEEIAASRRLFNARNWPIIDVTRRSIEETAASIISLLKDHRRSLSARADQ